MFTKTSNSNKTYKIFYYKKNSSYTKTKLLETKKNKKINYFIIDLH